MVARPGKDGFVPAEPQDEGYTEGTGPAPEEVAEEQVEQQATPETPETVETAAPEEPADESPALETPVAEEPTAEEPGEEEPAPEEPPAGEPASPEAPGVEDEGRPEEPPQDEGALVRVEEARVLALEHDVEVLQETVDQMGRGPRVEEEEPWQDFGHTREQLSASEGLDMQQTGKGAAVVVDAPPPPPPALLDPGFFAKITSAAAAPTYTVEEIEYTGAVWQTKAGGRTGVALELNGDTALVMDKQVWIWVLLDTTSAPLWVIDKEKELRWGKATATWTTGNTTTLDPCTAAGVDTGEPNVTAYIVSPTGGAPTVNIVPVISANDILAYIPYGTNLGVLVNVKWETGTGVGARRLIDRWKDCTGNVGETSVGAGIIGEEFITIQAAWNFGEPIVGGSWNITGITYYPPGAAGRVATDLVAGWHHEANYTVRVDLAKVHCTWGDFILSVRADDGELCYRVENWTARFQARFAMVCSGSKAGPDL